MLGKSEGYGSLSLGTFTTVNAEGAMNLPVGKDSALRLSLLSQTRNDWVKNTFAAGPTQDFEGYRDDALRAQWLYEPSKDFSALANLHARDFNGSARLFRANIIQPGTNDFVPGFDERKISVDGKNESKLQNYGANLRLRWGLGEMALHSITGFEQVHTFSRGDIDGGFGAYVPAAVRTRIDSVRVGIGRRHSQAQPVDAGVPARVDQQRPAELASRRLLVP